MTPAPDEVVDGNGLTCVRLILRLRDALKDLPAGAVVHVISTDPAAPLDLPAWCHLTRHRYLGQVPGRDPATYAMAVADRPVPTAARRPWHPQDATE